MIFEGNDRLPSLVFDEGQGYMKISGKSMTMDTFDFWDPLYDKVDEYLEEDPRDVHIEFDFVYFNTTAAKAILKFLKMVEKRVADGKKKMFVTWYYDDEDLKVAGEDYASMVDANWNIMEK